MAKDSNKKQGKENKHFFKDFKAELKRVIWPTPKQLFNNTVAVISIVLIVAVIVLALDFTFQKLNEQGIEKLKSVVVTNTETNTEATTNSQSTETGTSNETANSANVEENATTNTTTNTTTNKTENKSKNKTENKDKKNDNKNETTNTVKK